MTLDAPGHLSLLLPVARHTDFHDMHSRLAEQSPVGQVHVALIALDIVCHVGLVIDLVTGVPCYDVLNFVALGTRSCVNFSS
jgi:hypothetical protein